MEKVVVGKRVKRKRVSKKSKKSWRKHSDIKDVETYLEDKRLQERTGGLVAEKPDAELFVVDRGPDGLSEKGNLTQNRRQPKPLRCHAALVPDPRIPPIRIDRPRLPVQKEKEINITSGTQRRNNAVSKKAARKPAVATKTSQTEQKHKLPLAAYDLWGSEDIVPPPAGADEHYLTVCKKKRVKPPSYHYQKPSDLPAIETPHPGISYRPTDEDHKDLLRKAAELESKRLREERRIKRALDDKFPTIGDAPDENTWLKEWKGNDSDQEEEAESIGENAPLTSDVSHNAPVRREDKKSERERKRLKALKMKSLEVMKEKEEKIRNSKVLRLKSVKKEVSRQEMALAARAARRQLEREVTGRVMTRRLGLVKYQEPNIELKLTEEQADSLRLLKPEGSLLRDHFSSLQKRNMVEPRRRVKVTRKYKPKVFEKKSHREITN